jgi:hypothetical protein
MAMHYIFVLWLLIITTMGMTKEEENKVAQFTVEIGELIGEYVSEQQDNWSDEDFTLFIHALATVYPSAIMGKNWLEFNHLANKLVFQYATEKE